MPAVRTRAGLARGRGEFIFPGQIFKVPLESLSATDQVYVGERRAIGKTGIEFFGCEECSPS